jgi:hypothetical protein
VSNNYAVVDGPLEPVSFINFFKDLEANHDELLTGREQVTDGKVYLKRYLCVSNVEGMEGVPSLVEN